jgi:hypothetical protein
MSLLDTASLILTPNGYKASKLYSVKPTNGDGDMVVSRGTSATRVNSSGFIELMPIDVPRLDYTGGGCPSILVEPERINRVFYSEEFSNGYWLKYSAAASANTTTAPDGTLTADLVYPTATGPLTGQVYKELTTGITSGDVVTVSVFVKASGKNFAYISPVFNFSPGAWFNLTTGAITNPIANVTTSMTEFANGWWRISLTSTSTSSTSNKVTIGSTDATNSSTNTASGFNGILVWGAQVEVGTTATSYIPTVAGTVTRNADVISKTGVSSLIGQTEGTVVMDLNFANVGVEKYILILRDTASTNTISIRRLTTGAIRFALAATTVVGTTNQSSAVLADGNYKIAYKYISGTIKIFINGVLLFTLTPTFTFGTALSIIDLGHQNSLAQLNDRIKVLQLYQTALTDAQCISLTTP